MNERTAVYHPIFDCLTYLQSISAANTDPSEGVRLAGNGLAQACVQAEATRHAAKLAARTATNSSIVTLVAGALVVVAAWLSLRPAYEERARRRFSVSTELINETLRVRVMVHAAIHNLNARIKGQVSFIENVVVVSIDDRFINLTWLADSPFETHTIEAVRAVSQAYARLRVLVSMWGKHGIQPPPGESVCCPIQGKETALLSYFESALQALLACEDALIAEGWSRRRRYSESIKRRWRLFLLGNHGLSAGSRKKI